MTEPEHDLVDEKQGHLIESSRVLPFVIWVRDLILTTLVWLLFLYLIRDFFFFLGDFWEWMMGGFNNISSYSSFPSFQTVMDYATAIIIIFTTMMVWASYNILRFSGKSRRRTTKNVVVDEVAQRYRIPPRQMMAWQKAGSMVMHHDLEGRLLKVTVIE